jgi:hypothetical protein
MQFCQKHWDALKQAILTRGMGDYVSATGKEIFDREVANLEKPVSLETFDPLMAAHWMIAGNAMGELKRMGANPLLLMVHEPGSPCCPICLLNGIAEDHEANCRNAGCKWPIGHRYDNWIDKAADEAKEILSSLQPPKT